jgi:hypothetical protein
MRCTWPDCDNEAIRFYMVDSAVFMKQRYLVCRCVKHNKNIRDTLTNSRRISYEDAVIFEVHES